MKSLLLARQISIGPAERPRLSAVDLHLGRGDRLGLLGVNGAGKSTLMQILAGALAPFRGEVVLGDRRLADSPPGLRRQLGFLPQQVPAYRELTTRENLAWAGRLRGLRGVSLGQAVARVLDQVQLAEVADRLAGNLSAGMRQRLGLAQAMLHRPSVLILDEPTAGLDPLQAEQIRALLKGLPEETGMIIATHLLDDVEQLCNRVVLLDAGRKTAELAVTPDTDLLAHFRAQAALGGAQVRT